MVNAATQELNELKRQTQRQDAHPLHPTYPHLLVRVPFDAARIGHSLEGILNHPPQPHTPRVETNTHTRDPQSTGSQEPGSASSRIAIAALTRTSMNPCMHANNPQEEEALGPQDDLSYEDKVRTFPTLGGAVWLTMPHNWRSDLGDLSIITAGGQGKTYVTSGAFTPCVLLGLPVCSLVESPSTRELTIVYADTSEKNILLYDGNTGEKFANHITEIVGRDHDRNGARVHTCPYCISVFASIQGLYEHLRERCQGSASSELTIICTKGERDGFTLKEWEAANPCTPFGCKLRMAPVPGVLMQDPTTRSKPTFSSAEVWMLSFRKVLLTASVGNTNVTNQLTAHDGAIRDWFSRLPRHWWPRQLVIQQNLHYATNLLHDATSRKVQRVVSAIESLHETIAGPENGTPLAETTLEELLDELDGTTDIPEIGS